MTEGFPDLRIGDEIVGRFYVHGTEHLHQCGVIVGQISRVVQGRHPVGKAGQDIPKLPLFAVQLIDGLGDGIAHTVHGPGKDANLSMDVFVSTNAVIPVGQLDGYLGHFADGLVDFPNAGEGDDKQHRHDADAQNAKGIVQLRKGGVDMLYLPHKDQAALDGPVVFVERFPHGDGVDMVGQLQVPLFDVLALQDIELDVLDVSVVVFGNVGDGFDSTGGVVKIIVFHIRRAAQKAKGFGKRVPVGKHVVPNLVDALG